MAAYDRYYDYRIGKWRQMLSDEPSDQDPVISGPADVREPAPEYWNPETNRYQATPYTAPVAQPVANVVSEAEVAMARLAQEDRQFAASEGRASAQFARQMEMAGRQLDAEIASRQASAGESAADRAQRSADNAADRALRERLAEIQENMQILSIAYQAAASTGFIPQSLAGRLGIQGGPTLEAQGVAWKRYTDMVQMLSEPRDIVKSEFLRYGLTPREGAPIPFLQSLSEGRGVGTSNLGGNMPAISQAARESTAQLLEQVPPMFQNERLNPQAMAPVGGTSFISQLAGLTRGRQPATVDRNAWQTGSFLGGLAQPAFSFGGV